MGEGDEQFETSCTKGLERELFMFACVFVQGVCFA